MIPVPRAWPRPLLLVSPARNYASLCLKSTYNHRFLIVALFPVEKVIFLFQK